VLDDILLLQLRIGLLFPLFLAIGLKARGTNAGMHKRMMILATVMAIPASVDRITWLPTTMPMSPVTPDLYTLAMVTPMFLWDVIRNRHIHDAYWIWLAIYIPVSVLIQILWDTPWWHATARAIDGGPFSGLNLAVLVGLATAYDDPRLWAILTAAGHRAAEHAATLDVVGLVLEHPEPLAAHTTRAEPWDDPAWRRVMSSFPPRKINAALTSMTTGA